MNFKHESHEFSIYASGHDAAQIRMQIRQSVLFMKFESTDDTPRSKFGTYCGHNQYQEHCH